MRAGGTYCQLCNVRRGRAQFYEYPTCDLDPARLVGDNRHGGPERVIDVVEARAPNGFEKLQDVASHAELEVIVTGYSKMAGFDPVNGVGSS